MMQMALAGIGRIAQDQHVPALAGSSDWGLAATLSLAGRVEGVPAYAALSDLLAAHPGVRAISLCVPPAPRYRLARAALEAGLHVMLEKPPGATLAEVQALAALARDRGRTLFATWHSRMAAGVAPARDWLAGRRIGRVRVTWREDVRRWHPGQDWIFEPGGMGVFDPGINALSILTMILPEPFHLLSADLDIPANRQTPIAARLRASGDLEADFDFRQEGPQTWDIEIDTDAGPCALRHGGNVLEIGGRTVVAVEGIRGEYHALYARMAELVRQGASDVDLSPMIHVADALLLGARHRTDAFFWTRP